MKKMESRIVVFCCLLFSFAPLGSSATPRSPAEETKAADYSKEGYVIERLSSKAQFENDGTYSQERTGRVRIQSQAGIQEFGVLHLSYASATTTLEIVYVRVIKPDNRVVQTPAENVLDMPAEITREAPFYSDIKEKQVAVKGLEVGNTLEFQWRAQTQKPLAPGQFWFDFNFFKEGIALQEELEIRVPRDRAVKVQSPKVQPIITDGGAYRVYTWKTAHLEREPEKKSSAAQEEKKEPSIRLSTFRSWNDVGEWFRSLAAPQAVPTAEIQAKARELTAGAKTDSERVRALYDFVSTKFRYIGISLGVGRYQPHTAAEVLSNDYGDCKDKHTLFAALLAAVGVKAYPALINSETKIDPDVPSPGQFDHVITAVPQDKGYLFLDTTPEVTAFGHLLLPLRDKKALVIPDGGAVALVQTPADPPFHVFFAFEADGALDDSGTLTSKMQMTFRGDDEFVFRSAFRRAGQAQWKDVMQQISSNLGYGGTVSDVTATAPDALDTPFHIEYGYNRHDYSDWPNRRISPPFPPVFLPPVPDDADKSSEPIKLGSPDDITYRATVKLSSKSNPQLPSSVHLDQSFAEYRATYSFADGALHVERRLTSKSREIPPEQFEAYKKFRKAVEDDSVSMIALSSESADSVPGPYQPRADIERRIQELMNAASLDPSQMQSYKTLATSLVAAQRPKEALEVWKALERLSPDDADAPQNVGILLHMLKRYSESVPELEKALNRNPGFPPLLFQLGDSYVHTGDEGRAMSRFQELLKAIGTADTLNLVGYDLADHNMRLNDALDYAEQAVKEVEDDSLGISLDNLEQKGLVIPSQLSAYWDTLGWAHFRLGHLDKAETYLNAGWYLTQDPVTADHLGQLYEKQGKKHEAAVAYSHALSTGHAPEGTKARLDAVRPGGKYLAGEGPNPTALQDVRIAKVRVAHKPAQHRSAEFFLLFEPGPEIVGVKFISGSEELRDTDKAVAAAKFDVRFPDGSRAQILRRGLLDCEPEIRECMLALYPPGEVRSLN